MKKFIRGFGFAFNGLKYAYTTQLNFRVHVFAGLLAIAMGFFLQISAAEWNWVTLCIAMVLLTELLNTGIETLTDLVSPGYNKLAGHVKDVSAAAVLVTAFFALVTGCIIFLPKILALFNHAA
ncbi:diacylglycerol kinase family protein [Mucilaginibacter pedocola]|uniref:Diacylglycerol kinase n=1 Tax=Mucilaginibacter pedocola TaxID=1792845 RepID=A0A1S9PCC1_9SPHI|nr:diacylglycerol kinase family protein [Mucilaginibacter pedocola]OOQ58632.1 diacylglycerol kinase [Mucilaginibacter pedocola]